MKDVEKISAPLRRNIKSGKAYNKLMPDSSCVPISFGNGNNNTIEGVEFMSEMVKDYQHHVEKLAPILKGQTLADTVLNVKEFLYNHIQYLGDGNLQQLRSPACAWHQRQTGVDCKSYTIFAVALLRQLGITTYIRQIKQPLYYQDQYTHVYAIVPKDQNNTPNTSNFTGDYYVVDATLQHNNEAHFTQKKDKLMSGLPYVGLAGTATASPVNDTSIDNLLKMAPAFQNAGFTQQEWENLIRYIETLKLEGFTDQQIIFRLQKNGIVIKTKNSNGRLFSPQRIDNGQWLRRFFQTTQGLGNASEGGKGSGGSGIDEIIEGTIGGGSGIDGIIEGTIGGGSGIDGIIDDIIGGDGWIDNILGDIGSFFGDIGGFFGIGSGGWYDNDEVELHAQELINHFNMISGQITQAAAENDLVKLRTWVMNFKGHANVFVKNIAEKIKEGYSSKTTNNLRTIKKLAEKYQTNGIKALDAWLNKFYNISESSLTNTYTYNDVENVLSGQQPHYVNPSKEHQVNFIELTPKNTEDVKAFYVDDYALEANEYSFNASSYLNQITEIIRTFTGGGNNTPTTPSTGGGNNTPTTNSGGNNTSSTGGGNTVRTGQPLFSDSQTAAYTPNTGKVKMSSIGWGVGAIGAGLLAKVLYDNFTKNKK